jgi:hypothetical protein
LWACTLRIRWGQQNTPGESIQALRAYPESLNTGLRGI